MRIVTGRWTVVGVTLAVLLLGACGDDDDGGGEAAVGSTTTEAVDDATTTSTEVESTTPDIPIGPATFLSPTGNIGCLIDAEFGARCDIREARFDAPAKPADCDLEWGDSIAVTEEGADFICHGDTAFGAEETLAYGAVAQRGAYNCASTEQGMVCGSNANGASFTISRDTYTIEGTETAKGAGVSGPQP